MTDFLEEKRREIEHRISELASSVKEYERLQEALSALSGIPGTASGANGAPRASSTGRRSTGTPASARRPGRRGRPPAAASAGTAATAGRAARRSRTARRGGRPKGSSKRGAEALALIQAQPGITIPEIAEKMSIKPNYLYRVLPPLQQEKKISKRGKGWHARESVTADAS